MNLMKAKRFAIVVLVGACLMAVPHAEASSTNVNENADEIALSCSWIPDYAKAPGTFVFVASVTCNEINPPDPDQQAGIDAGVYGNTNGVNQVTLIVTNVAPGPLTVVFSGGDETFSAEVYALKVDIEQEREDYCNHYPGTETLDLTTDSYLGPLINKWYWDGDYIIDGNSYYFPPSLLAPCGVEVRAEAQGFPACCDTCKVNIVKVDLAAEGFVCVTNGTTGAASRKQITIDKCDPASWDGHVQLFWAGGGGVKVYTAPSNGVEVTSGETFANANLPTNLWVEGTTASDAIDDVVYRLNPVLTAHPCPQVSTGCGKGTMTVIKMEITKFNGYPLGYHGSAYGYYDQCVFSREWCTLQAEGSTGLSSLNSALVWNMEAIPDTTLESDPTPANGSKVSYEYTGQPANNTDYAPERELALSHVLFSDCQVTTTLHFFFSATAPYMNQAGPNWFVYWKQDGVVAGLQTFTFANYSPGLGGGELGFYDTNSCTCNITALAWNGGHQSFIVTNSVTGTETMIGLDLGDEYDGINRLKGVASVCAHELKHKEIHEWRIADPIDSDADGVPDAKEWELGLNPLNCDTYNLANNIDPSYYIYGDEEFLCRLAETNCNAILPAKDWSADGCNWRE